MEKERFEIKPEHLKLIQRFCIGWQDCEFGAPEIDPKRPYGNSDVIQDMVEVLGFEEIDPERFLFKLFGEEYRLKGEDKYNIEFDDQEKLVEILTNLHKETEIALQICLETQIFQTGIFKHEKYGGKWEKA